MDFKVETSEKGTVATEVTVKVPAEEAGVGLLDVIHVPAGTVLRQPTLVKSSASIPRLPQVTSYAKMHRACGSQLFRSRGTVSLHVTPSLSKTSLC